MIDMGLFRECCSVVTILPQILSLNPLEFVHALSIRTSQLDQRNRIVMLWNEVGDIY